MFCCECEFYKHGMCNKYEVPVNKIQKCIETGVKNEIKKLPKNLIEDDNINVNNVVIDNESKKN